MIHCNLAHSYQLTDSIQTFEEVGLVVVDPTKGQVGLQWDLVLTMIINGHNTKGTEKYCILSQCPSYSRETEILYHVQAKCRHIINTKLDQLQ